MNLTDRIGWTFVVLALLTVLTGCDNSLEPFDEDAGLFSIYGYLTLSQEQHFLRIRNLNEPVVEGSTRPLDATVTLENLATGTTETLTDSIVTFDGTYTHNFRSDQDIQPGVQYRVTVERPDGRASHATATMPEVTVAEIDPAHDAPCNNIVRIRFPEISEVRFVNASIGLKYGGEADFINVPLVENPRSGQGVFFGFKPAVVVEEVVPETIPRFVDCDPSRYCSLLDDKKIRVAYTHFGPDWPADSARGEVFASDVRNGLGAFGGLRRDTLVATLDTELRCPGAQTVPCQPVDRPPRDCPDVGELSVRTTSSPSRKATARVMPSFQTNGGVGRTDAPSSSSSP